MPERLNVYTELLAARDHLDAILSQVSPEDFHQPQTAHQRAKRDLFRALYDGPPAILHRLQLERVNGQVARRSCLCGGWEWLGSPEVAPLRPWIDLATADARPGERVGIAYDPDAERADAATFAAMAAEHGNVQSSQYDVSTRAGYAAAWWQQRQG